MATKKEIKQILKELNLTEEDMDNFWTELLETNWKVRALNKSGQTWRSLSVCAIKQLPTQKEEDLKNAKKAEEEKQLKEEQEAEERRKEVYYSEHFEEIMVSKIDNGEELTEDELSKLVSEYSIDTEYDENERWTRSALTIVELSGRTFAIVWEEALTESQEDYFNDQPYEVEMKTYQKTITVTDWIKIEKKEV